MNKIAVLIAVENYSSAGVPKVSYAKNDAVALSEAFALHGFDKADQILLIDSDATKAAIESKVRRAIRGLTAEDTLFFFFAGHAFSKSGQNFIAGYDAQEFDLPESSVAFDPLLQDLRRSACQHIALFLHGCASDLPTSPDVRGSHSGLQTSEIEAVLRDTEHGVCFASCGMDEKSHPSNRYRHGVWTYHLLEALLGNAPSALRNGVLVSSGLQSYLQSEVANTLSVEHTTPIRQTPWMSGAASGEFSVADLRSVLQARRDRAAPNNNVWATETSFVAAKSSRTKSLSSWRTSHRLPERVNESSRSFIAGLATADVQADIDSFRASLRNAFGFTRRELTVSEVSGGSATIITPHFNYSVSVDLSSDDVSEVIWTRTVDAIKSPEQILSDAFGSVFDRVFNTLKFAFPTRIKLEDLIDAVEALKSPSLAVDYDAACTYCNLKMAGSPETVRVTPHTLEIVHPRLQETKALIESFQKIRSLVEQHDVPQLFQSPR